MLAVSGIRDDLLQNNNSLVQNIRRIGAGRESELLQQQQRPEDIFDGETLSKLRSFGKEGQVCSGVELFLAPFSQSCRSLSC